MHKIIWAVLLSIFTFSCTGSKQLTLLKQGNTKQTAFYEEISFRYVKDHIFVDVEIDGKLYNFLFDTGYAISFIEQSLIKESGYQSIIKDKLKGSSFKKHKVGYGFIPTLKIGAVDFTELGIGTDDLAFINQDYICEQKVDGIIGANLMRKAHWQIDYEQQIIRFTNDWDKLTISPQADQVQMKAHQQGYGYCSLSIQLDSIKKDFILDTGSGGAFTTGLENWEQIKASEPVHSLYLTNASPASKRYLIQVRKAKMGDFTAEQAVLSLEEGVASLLGNDFLKHYRLSIDWSKNLLFLERNTVASQAIIRDWALLIRPDWEQNKIVIGAKRSGTEYENVVLNTPVLKVNDFDLSQLSRTQLCDFWQKEWPRLSNQKEIFLSIKGKEAPIRLRKESLFSP
ncbi:MAG: aspartyl protease family protein [Bacteroidota bacterium]